MKDYVKTPNRKKDYISSQDWHTLEQDGKLKTKDFATIICYFCNTHVTQIETDARNTPMPKCSNCDVYYEPQWRLQNGILTIRILPRTHHSQHTEHNAIPHTTLPEQTPIPQKPKTKNNTAPQHKDVRNKILKYIQQKKQPIKTAELRQHINASRQSINTQINKLINQGRIQKITRGTYQITQYNNAN